MRDGRMVLMVLLFSLSLQAGEPVDSIYCVGSRKFSDPSPRVGFNFRPTSFSLPNAYWLAIASSDVYLEKNLILQEIGRWGFTNNVDPLSDDHLFFMDENREAKLDILGQPLVFRYADSQAFWAENKDGVLIVFRGTTPGNIADALTDANRFPVPFRNLGEVHEGFLAGLKILWNSIYARTRQLRKRDFKEKYALLDHFAGIPEDQWPATWDSLKDWKIPDSGKSAFLNEWKRINESTTLPPEEKEEKHDELLKFLNIHWITRQKPIWLAGHSLGAGLATITAAQLMYEGFNVGGLYTYGSPRVGSDKFAHLVEVKANEMGIREQLARFINQYDVVARMPPLTGVVLNGTLDGKWKEIGRTKYFTGKTPESGSVELVTDALELFELPQFPSQMLEHRADWFLDHSMKHYIKKLEHIVFGSPANCS